MSGRRGADEGGEGRCARGMGTPRRGELTTDTPGERRAGDSGSRDMSGQLDD